MNGNIEDVSSAESASSKARLKDVFSIDRMELDVQVSSKKRMLEVMSNLFTKNNNYSINKDIVFRALLSRESLGSTCVGNGVVLPHGRLSGLPNPIGAIIRMSRPLDLQAEDAKPVNLACGLLVPADCADVHVNILAKLARGFVHQDLHRRLIEAQDMEAMYDEITKFDNSSV